jgi:hypothetical protein
MQQGEMQDKMHRVEEKASEAAGKAKEGAKGMIEKGRVQAAENLESVARAFRKTSTEIGGENAMAAKYTDFAARQAENMAEYLRGRDVEQVLDRVESFARRRPEVFLGGAFAIGFMLSRFLKSSRPGGGRVESGYRRYGYEAYGPRTLGESSTRGEWTREPSTTEAAVRRPMTTTPGVGPT